MVFGIAAIVGVLFSVLYLWKDYRARIFRLSYHFQRIIHASFFILGLLLVALVITMIAQWDEQLEWQIRLFSAALGSLFGILIGYTGYASEAEIEHGQ